MDQIIDAHSHLGDILYPGGGDLIDRKGVTKEPGFDMTSVGERSLYWDPLGLGRTVYRLTGRWVTKASRARNRTATLENFRRSMDEVGITHSVSLPIPPYVKFEDVRRATEKDPGVIPFTGVDYTRNEDPGPALAADVKAGARGLKLHPIIQNLPLTSRETRRAVEAFGTHGLPVLLHCGVSSYYLREEGVEEHPEYGEIRHAYQLVKDFPDVHFIAGHSGLFEIHEVVEMLGGCKNVWAETSIQSVATVRKLIAAFGPDRVLFGSDWPFGNRQPAVAIVKAACRSDRGLERRIFFENAAELLGMN